MLYGAIAPASSPTTDKVMFPFVSVAQSVTIFPFSRYMSISEYRAGREQWSGAERERFLGGP